MNTIDEIVMHAPVEVCFNAAADVEGWPAALGHYRWVKFQRRDAFGTGRVEMAARRAFGPFGYPVWWVSEMSVDQEEPEVLYTHVDGITTGMTVIWSFHPIARAATRVRIVHDWEDGPQWPVPPAVRRWIANVIIGPVFIHHVATRTLEGIGAKAEAIYREAGSIR